MTAPPANEFLSRRGRVIADRLVAAALHDRVRIGADEQVPTGTVLKDKQEFPAISVQRLPGGGIDSDSLFDRARLAITAFGTNREQSDELVAEIRDAMRDLSDGEYAGVVLDNVREETGPGRVPDPNPRLFAIPTTWVVSTREQ